MQILAKRPTAGRLKFTRYEMATAWKRGSPIMAAFVVSLTAPGRDGRFADVVLGYDRLDGYLKASPYFGALVGRYANRIGGAKFSLNGKTYRSLKTADLIPCMAASRDLTRLSGRAGRWNRQTGRRWNSPT